MSEEHPMNDKFLCPRCGTPQILAPGIDYYCPKPGCEIQGLKERFRQNARDEEARKQKRREAVAIAICRADKGSPHLPCECDTSTECADMLAAADAAIAAYEADYE